jgi:hypothetical protein
MKTKKIPLTKGAFAIVNAADYARLVQIGKWSLSNQGYAIHWYKDEAGKRKCLYIHRVIMDAPPHLHIDHIDTNKLNNTRENLRYATRSQNNAARNRMKSNTSGFTGVNLNRKHWECRIKYQNRRIFLGNFPTARAAALAYDCAARIVFKEFARPNLPDEVTPPEIEAKVRNVLARTIAID